MVGAASLLASWEALLESLRRLTSEGTGGRLAVALSGGLDSRFLTHAALAAGCDVLALHARGAHMSQRESVQTLTWAAAHNLACHSVNVTVLTLPGVADNSRERCYHCKKHLLECLRDQAAGYVLCDGTNADDMKVYRPGLRALAESGVRSPLAEAGLGKDRVHALAAATGLENPAQVARPCLLTRWAYGLRPDVATLGRLETAEAALEALGLKDFRLRLLPEPLLQTLPLTALQRTMALGTLEAHDFSRAQVLEEERLSGYFDR